jgi:hypothetical protein
MVSTPDYTGRDVMAIHDPRTFLQGFEGSLALYPTRRHFSQ